MVFRITGGITIDGGLTSSGREPDPPSDVSAAKVNDTTVRLTVTDPVNTGGLAITEYTAKTYISYQNPDLSFSYYLIPSATATNNINVIDVTNNYGGGDGPVEYVFDGATFFEIPYNAKFELANNSFAIEAFITPTTTNVLRGIVNNWNIGGAFNWYINTNNTLTFTYTYTTSGANEITYTGSTVIQPNVRTHVVIQKVGANMQFFINGVPDPVTYTGNFNFRFVYFYNNVKKPLRYGICSDGTGYFTGKMSNLRISFKQYLYGGGTNASFPVPSLPLETTQDAVYSGATKIIESLVPSEVLLLVLSDARPGKDKSTNDWSSALNGGVTITGKVEYVFRVTAKNAVGTSLESPASNIVRYLGPNAPTIDTATIVNNTNASVTFTPPAVNVDGPIIDYLVVSTPGNFNAIGTTSPITVSGLIKGTNYTFTVAARNKFAQGTASVASNSVTAIGVPDVPIAGTVTITSATTATVTFSPPVNTGGLPITQYMVYSVSPGATEKLVTSSPALITGLSAGNTYSFRVYAYNSLGYGVPTAESSAMTAYFLVPNAPTIGVATMTGQTTASVTFTVPVTNGGPSVTSYTVISTPDNITATGTSSPISITGLTAGTTYTFTVTATNIIGTSPSSSASNAIVYILPGQIEFTTAGSTSWVVPAGVTSISAVCIGGGGGGSGGQNYAGGGGGAGGALAYVNNIPVTPNETLTVQTGLGGTGVSGLNGNAGGESFIRRGTSTFLVRAGGGGGGIVQTGPGGTGGTVLVGSGGAGGNGGNPNNTGGSGGGGGSGGYSGAGGNGGNFGSGGQNGSGGSGGGGGGGSGTTTNAGGGGGVGLLGQVTNGTGGSVSNGGTGGSYGLNGTGSTTFAGYPAGGSGGSYGGGGGGGKPMADYSSSVGGNGTNGAVRIIWSGSSTTTRAFPSTNTGDYYDLPSAPTIGTATVLSSTSARVSFTAPSNTGGLPITGYTVTSNPGGITATGSSSPITVSGLTTGTSYTFKVSATNSVGTGPQSSASNAITPIALNAPTTIDYVVVAGGGGGGVGTDWDNNSNGGGGGAGGYLTQTNVSVSAGVSYTITVGNGGVGAIANGSGINATATTGTQGGNSSISGSGFTTVTAVGGGYGGYYTPTSGIQNGGNGGSGGGAGGAGGGQGRVGGIGIYPGSTYLNQARQGYNGGDNFGNDSTGASGGGGGAGASGSNGAASVGGNGGAGVVNPFAVNVGQNVSGTYWLAGGGGGTYGATNTQGTGGNGGGANGKTAALTVTTGNNGSLNTGGGGGGLARANSTSKGGTGGTGVVIIRYSINATVASSTTGSPTVSTDANYRYYVFTGNGSITF